MMMSSEWLHWDGQVQQYEVILRPGHANYVPGPEYRMHERGYSATQVPGRLHGDHAEEQV